MIDKKIKHIKLKKHSAVLVCVILVSGLALDTIFIGNIAYYVKWAQCNEKPIVLSHPQKVGFGDTAHANRAIINPVWLRAKATPTSSETSLHCSIDDLRAKYGTNLEICKIDNVENYIWPSKPCQ